MKIFCIGRNYVDHAVEMQSKVPTKPMIFMKPPTALLIKNRPFFYPDFSSNIHYEAEIVLKIGKNGRSVEEKFAGSYIDGIAFGLDMTARDLQAQCKEKGHPWEIAKGFDRSAPISSFIDLPTNWEDGISFELKQNGNTVQAGNTKDLVFPFATLISYISKFFTVQKGDYIFTGTPSGVGPITIGDTLQGFIEGEQLLECRVK